MTCFTPSRSLSLVFKYKHSECVWITRLTLGSRSEWVRPEASSLWAPLHEQLWKLQVLLSQWLHLNAWWILHQWVISFMHTSRGNTKKINLYALICTYLHLYVKHVFFCVIEWRFQDMLSCSLSVWLRGSSGGDSLPLPIGGAATCAGWEDVCR